MKGLLKGTGQYDKPNYHFEGQFVKGIPAGKQQHVDRISGCAQGVASAK